MSGIEPRRLEEVIVTLASDCTTGRVSGASAAVALAVEPPEMNRYLTFKARVDFFLAVLLLIPSLPLMILAMILVKVTSRGPSIYCQSRAGHHGRLFTIYKIRTMGNDSERLTGAQW